MLIKNYERNYIRLLEAISVISNKIDLKQMLRNLLNPLKLWIIVALSEYVGEV